MNVAVVVSGQMRTLDQCLPSLRKHLLDRLDHPDVFVHAADDADAPKADLLDPVKLVVEEQPILDEKNYIARTGRGVSNVQAVLRQLWTIQKANSLKKQAEALNGKRYDWVVRLRPDTQFFSDIEDLSQCDPAAVYLPTFCNYCGFNDRFAFGGSKAMDAYSEKLSLLDDYIAAGGIFHPESFLKWALERASLRIERTEAVFDTLRSNGKRIRPVWEQEFGDVVPAWKQSLFA